MCHDIAFAHPLHWLISSSFFSPPHTLDPPAPRLPLSGAAVEGAMFGAGQGGNWCIISVLFAASFTCLMPCVQLSRSEDLG